jgi:O-antigen/teichoic acid export membrane protein
MLTPAEFGVVTFATTIAMLASAITPVGFSEALIQRTDIDHRHINTVFWLCLGSAVVVYAVVVLCAWPLADYFEQPELAPFLIVIGIRIFFDLGTAIPNALLTRSMSFNRIAIRTTVASSLAAVVCFAVLAMGYGAWALALSQVTTAFATFVGAMLSTSWKPKLEFSPSALLDLRRYGLFASANRVISMINVDQLMIGSLFGARPLGLFGFARRVFDILTGLLSGALNSVSYSLLSSLQREQEKMREAFLVATFLSSVLSFPLFCGLAAVASDLVPVAFGPQWVDGVIALQAFCAIGLLACISILQSSLIKSAGHADWWTWYMLGKQVLNGIFVYWLYRYGFNATVLGLAAMNFLYWPVSVFMAKKLLQLSVLRYLRTFLSPAFSALVMVLAVLLVKEEMSDFDQQIRLVAAIAAGAGTYAVATLVLSRRKLLDVLKMARKRREA